MKHMIEQTETGVVLGIYEAESTEEAWQACAADAGQPEAEMDDSIVITEVE